MRCPSCHSDNPDAHRFCASCGSPLPSATQLATTPSSRHSSAQAVIVATPAGRALAGDAGDSVQGFTPGTIVRRRYRIVGLVGRGGMGEVYRADDIKLGTPVALKFLPRALRDDPLRRDRFLAEVRIARQIAHPNVCRVFDIDELEGGQPFLTMEYIDGEDLASLLLRIGRLPADKALDIARQICAGLAAAHDKGVLHRDLKPANVMLDGRGRVRITDFGLAVAEDASGLAWDVSGTPAYMAPEQLAGKGASVRSDIYALGVVLYELYTGKRPFASASLEALRDRTNQGPPPAPSELVEGIDAAIDRVILRAISSDPRARPGSAAQVAAALPGGDQLHALLRAGETPSPELVAASGRGEGLEPAKAWGLLVLVVAGTIAAAALGARGLLWRHSVPDKSPDALAADAREMMSALGYGARGRAHASGLEVDLDYLRYLQAREPIRWRSIRPVPGVIRFWYRESPQPLEAWRFPYQYGNVSRITPADPPLEVSGMTLIRLDGEGRLMHLVVVPPAAEDGGPAAATPDWDAILARAGLDPSGWQRTEPRRTPPVFADARAAWEGTWPGAQGVPVRLEAAALRGTPVYFEAVYPWTPPPRTPSPVLTPGERAGVMASFLLAAGVVVGTAAFARRNLRAGRGDRRGAFRVATFVFAAMLVSWFFGESHVATLWEFALVVMALSCALAAAGACWLAYLAIEPFLRRRWPELLVSWTRLLAGEFRDPLVGRDLLVGCMAGPLLATVGIAGFLIPEWLGRPTNLVFADVYGVAYGVRGVMPLLTWRAAQAVLAGLACVFLLLLLRLWLRSTWTAVAAFVVVGTTVASAGAGDVWLAAAFTAIHFGAFAALIVRFGLLAAVAQFYVWGLFIFFPITADLGAWYAGGGVAALFVLGALTLLGFTASLGGRPVPGR